MCMYMYMCTTYRDIGWTLQKYIVTCIICSIADDADEETADQAEMGGSSTPMNTSQLPPDPTKGLP